MACTYSPAARQVGVLAEIRSISETKEIAKSVEYVTSFTIYDRTNFYRNTYSFKRPSYFFIFFREKIKNVLYLYFSRMKLDS